MSGLNSTEPEDVLDNNLAEKATMVSPLRDESDVGNTSASKGVASAGETAGERGGIMTASVHKVGEMTSPVPKGQDQITYVVPDGGWGWLVAIGGFIITMLLSSLGPCFGILFSRFLLESGASSVLTAWIFNVKLFIWHIIGPLVRPLSEEFGWRRVGLFGVIMCSVSFIISAFSPSAVFLFFSFSLLSGIGGGLVVSMCYMIVPQYFDRHRGKANAIMMIGLCMGQILKAPLVRYLQDQEGFIGSTFIFGAIMLNGCVGVSFFHPVEWHMKKVKKDEDQEKALPEEAQEPLVSQRTKTLENGNEISKRDIKGPTSQQCLKDDDGEDSCFIKVDRNDQESTMGDNLSSINHKSSSKVSNNTSSKENNKGPMRVLKLMGRVAKSTIRDLKILRHRRAMIIAFGNMLCMNAYFNFVMMVPFAMQAMNFTLQDSAWCITVMGIFNLFSRIIISILSDCKWFNMRLCSMIGFAALSVVMFVFPLLGTVTWLVLLMGVFGFGLAATISLLHLVMIQYMGMENLAPMFGSTCLLIGIGFPTFGPLIGFIRDCSGSYLVSMWVLSAMTLSAFILWVFMPAAVTYDTRRKESERNERRELATSS